MTVQHDPVEIVTVGAGWTAAILASKLCPGGTKMVSIEQGSTRWTYPEFAHDHDGLRYSQRYAMMVDLARMTWTWRPDPRSPSLPMRQYGIFNPGQGVGGSAIHWSAQLWRFLRSDFEYRSHYVDRYGEDKLPEGNTIRDWPVSYDDLETYYDAFDYDIGSSGKAGNLQGRLVEGGNIFESPRSREYPNPPLPSTTHGEMFARAGEELGLHPFQQPAGILSRAWTNPWGQPRSGCLYCGFCTRYGCEVDAKASPVNTHLPVALETGNYEIRTNCVVHRVETDSDGRATGITYVDKSGVEHFQPAETVVLSAFTLENVRLLLLSQGGRHEGGIGNDRGQVGRNYTHQLYYTPVNSVFDRRLHTYMGNVSTVKVIFDYTADVFDHSELDFIGGALMFSEPGERQPVTSVGDFTSSTGKAWGADWKAELGHDWDKTGGVTIQGESLPYEDQFLDLDPNYNDMYGRPLLRMTFDWHENDRRLYRFMARRAFELNRAMNPRRVASFIDELPFYELANYKTTHPTGGAIMGDDPATSVTNSYGQVWDTPNVFVTGAALFPQNPSQNPTGTVAALAYRTGDAIRDHYLDAPGELL